MREETIIVQNRLGLHARVAARIVRLSNQFRCHLTLRRVDDGRTGDAKSIFGILLLAATQGTELVVTASGEDEDVAIRHVRDLIEQELKEDYGGQSES